MAAGSEGGSPQVRLRGACVRGFLPLAGVAAALFAVGAAFPAPSTPTVDEIVGRYIAARGGLSKIRAIQALREKGRITTGANREALVTRELKRPSRTRFEFTLQGVTGVFVSDGQRGWKVSPFDGAMEPQPLPDEVVKEAAEQSDIEGPLVDWKAKGHQAELMGRETVDGREAYKVKLTLKSGAVRYEYLDVKSFHMLRTDSTRQVRGRPVQVQTTFGDYKKTGGVLFPRRIEVGASGRPQKLTVTVDSVEINPPLSDALFEMSDSAKP
jgi:outer membrane lipoprotein-sorting protein